MSNSRKTSLDDIDMPQWRWLEFLDEAIKALSCFHPKPCSVSADFINKEAFFGSKSNLRKAKTVTWACKTQKIRKARAACIDAGERASVLNFVVTPYHYYDLPFFGADFVTLPSGHLLALDLQPALKDDLIHTQNVWSHLIPIHEKWQALLPSGGSIPQEAKSFFSPGFLWSRIPLGEEGETLIRDVLKPAFKDYFSLYIRLINSASRVSKDRSLEILSGQESYMNYRSEKDPARGMLRNFYGNDWTEKYINSVLFDLD